MVLGFVVPLLLIAGVAVNQFRALLEWLQESLHSQNAAFDPALAFDSLTHRVGLDRTAIVEWARQHSSELASMGAAVVSTVDNFLRPRLVPGRVGQSEIVMFFASRGGMSVFGVLGIVLGPVIFATEIASIDVLSEAGRIKTIRRLHTGAPHYKSWPFPAAAFEGQDFRVRLRPP